MKVNLGCGDKHLQGFVNVDLAMNWCDRQPDVVADVTKALPFETGSVEQVHAYHIIEHINRWQVPAVLAEWVRVIKPGGWLVLECPCLDKILSLFDHFHTTGEPLNFPLTMWGLYGDPGHASEAMSHRWCYSVSELTGLLMDRGLKVTEETPQTHVEIRDMRLIARKP